MGVDIRLITDDDVEAWVTATRHGFMGQPAEGEVEFRRPHIRMGHTWGAFDGTGVVGTLAAFPFEVTVPGGRLVPAAAVTAVTVLATHRRQGLMTRMLTPALEAARDRGDPVSILIAAEWPIYGRFGFGPATEAVELAVDASTARFLAPRPDGTVELVTPETIREVAPGLYDRARVDRPGEIPREPHRWDLYAGLVAFPGEKPWSGFQVLYRTGGGEVEGYLQYEIKGEWDHRRPNQVLAVEELCALTPDAYHALWRYACEVDWVTTVKAELRAADEPLRHLLADGRAVRETDRSDFVWLRPVDTAAALAARRYPVAGALVLEVADPSGLSGGRFRLEGGPDGATCAPSDRPADLTLPLAALGAAYLGGTPVGALAAAGWVDEHTPGAVRRADTMLRGERAPWCTTWF